MKQLLFCYKNDGKLKVRYTTLLDVFIPVEDVVSPQKTSIILPKTNKIELYDIIIIRDNNTAKIEYIGYIDTLTNKTTTEISCYPLINIFDNDFVLDQLFQKGINQDGTSVDVDVDVSVWLTNQIKRAFVDTDDKLQAIPFFVRNRTKKPVLYKRTLETANLFEVYTDLFLNTGIYIKFEEIEFDVDEVKTIYCDIYCNTDENPYMIREDYPTIQSVDIVDNTFTSYNKIIATEELEEGITRQPQRYYFYLLNDNSITTNADDSRRIKQVRSKEITFSFDSESTNKEVTEALILAVCNELQATEYNLQITISMLKNENVKVYRSVEFVANNGTTYHSNVTKIQVLNDKQVVVTLGALRNSLTDFKKKIEVI